MSVNVRVDGVWLSTVAAAGDLELIDGRHGPLEAAWSMALRSAQRPPCLRRGAVVEAYSGAMLNWSGTLEEPDWSGLRFTAVGISRAGENAECLNGAGAITSKPNTAIDEAAARGVVPWYRGTTNFGDTALAGPEGGAGVSDPEPGKLNQLLDARSVEVGDTWHVAADGNLTTYVADEAAPDWLILPGVAVLGVAGEDVTDRVFLRYFDSTDSEYRTASYPASTPPNGIERRASVAHLGPMTLARATAIATGMYGSALAGRTGWTNGIEIAAGQIITPGGLDADLSLIRGGHVVSLLDTPDPRGVGRNLNVVIDTCRWNPAERVAQLNPVGLAARTWEQVMTEAMARGD